MYRKIAVVAGATGLTGRYLVEVLAEDAFYDEVIALVRAPSLPRFKKVEERVVDLENLEPSALAGATHLFCCLGTTLARAGSKEAFRKVDLEMVERFARAGREAGANWMALVSSIGTGEPSGNFYLKVKAEAEQAVAGVGFDSLHVFRPSVLLGSRAEKRAGEAWGQRLARALEWALVGGLRKYRPMPAGVLASAMAAAGERGGVGRHIHEYDSILKLARG